MVLGRGSRLIVCGSAGRQQVRAPSVGARLLSAYLIPTVTCMCTLYMGYLESFISFLSIKPAPVYTWSSQAFFTPTYHSPFPQSTTNKIHIMRPAHWGFKANGKVNIIKFGSWLLGLLAQGMTVGYKMMTTCEHFLCLQLELHFVTVDVLWSDGEMQVQFHAVVAKIMQLFNAWCWRIACQRPNLPPVGL